MSGAPYPRDRIESVLLKATFPDCYRIVPGRYRASPLGTIPADSRFCSRNAGYSVLYAAPDKARSCRDRNIGGASGPASRAGAARHRACPVDSEPGMETLKPLLPAILDEASFDLEYDETGLYGDIDASRADCAGSSGAAGDSVHVAMATPPVEQCLTTPKNHEIQQDIKYPPMSALRHPPLRCRNSVALSSKLSRWEALDSGRMCYYCDMPATRSSSSPTSGLYRALSGLQLPDLHPRHGARSGNS